MKYIDLLIIIANCMDWSSYENYAAGSTVWHLCNYVSSGEAWTNVTYGILLTLGYALLGYTVAQDDSAVNCYL